MFAYSMKWYETVLKGFSVHILPLATRPGGIENILYQLQIKDQGEEKEIFYLLSQYLKNIWNKGAYNLVIDFLVCIKAEDKMDYESLYEYFYEDPSYKKIIDIAEKEIEMAKEIGIYDRSFTAVANRIYIEGIVGKDIDLENIRKEDIDFISQKTRKKNYHAIFKPLFQYLLEKDELDLMWYLFNEYIVEALIDFEDHHIYNYLSLYLGEIMGIMWNFANIEEVYIEIDNRKLGVLPITRFDLILDAWKAKDENALKDHRNKILFGDSKLPEEMMVDEKLLDNLLDLYNNRVYHTSFLPDDMKDYFTYLIAVLLLYFNRSDQAAKFIYGNNKYYKLDTLNALGLLVSVALESDDFETVNMLYGIFLTEKGFLSNLMGDLENHIEESLEILKELKDLFDEGKQDNLYDKQIKISRESFGDKLSKEEEEYFLKYNLKDIEAFRYKFFEEIGSYELIEEGKNYKELGSLEIREFGEKLNLRLKAIFEGARIDSIKTRGRINFLPRAQGINAVINEDTYIETYMIPSYIKDRSKKAYNKYRAIGPRINNIKYEFLYITVNKLLSEKTTYLYMENMNTIVEKILKEKPERYKKIFIKEWNEKKAEKIFIKSYKNHKENIDIEKMHKNSFREDKYKTLNKFKQKDYDQAYEYFVKTYNEGDESYKDMIEDEDLRKILLTAEWFWNKEVEDNPNGDKKVGQEFTYLVANYLKSVEIYLVKKLEKIYGEYNIGNKGKSSLQGFTLGNLYHEVNNYPEVLEDELLEKINSYLRSINFKDHYSDRHKQNPVFKYLKDFTDKSRNGYFHKDSIVEFSVAENIRDTSLYVLRRISIDFKN